MSVQTDPDRARDFQERVSFDRRRNGRYSAPDLFLAKYQERRDYSSAVFDAAGNVIAMGDDMPVHLGSMPMSVRAALDALSLDPGDIAILNDPYAGGTHLPDITLVMPVFVTSEEKPVFFVANRAHHADVGGMYPGSMGPCREIFQEGLRIPPVKLYLRGHMNSDVFRLILKNVRTPGERDGDLTAQIGACRIGVERVLSLVEKYGLGRVQANIAALLDHSERMMRAELKQLPRVNFAPKMLWMTTASPTPRYRYESSSAPIPNAVKSVLISRNRLRR